MTATKRRIRLPQPDVLEVTLFRKRGCGLCDQAEIALARVAKRVQFRLNPVDIDTDPELQARYFLEVPVVAIGENEIARAPMSEWTLEDAIVDYLETAQR